MIDKSSTFDKSKKVKVIKSDSLSRYYDDRYVIIDEETGSILDDAQGYGYKSIKGAYSAWSYKTRDKSKDKERNDKIKHIRQWLKDHKDFKDTLDMIAFDIVKGSGDKLDAKLVKSLLKEENLEIDFKPTELLKVYLKG